MTIVIIGPTDSIWIKTYIEYVLLDQDVKIYIIGDKENQYKEFYDNNGIIIIESKPSKRKGAVSRIFHDYLYPIIAVNKIENRDILHVHYINNYSIILANILKHKFKKIIFSYWGSDLLRESEGFLKKTKKYLFAADYITVETEYMKQFFNKVFGDTFCDNLKVVDFGVNGYKYIDYCSKRIEHEMFAFPENKKIIVVGYNASDKQQHLKVIEQFSKLSTSEAKSIYVVFPMTYRMRDKHYLDIIIDEMSKYPLIEYCIITDFMDNLTSAELCIKTDIMIHAQTTDALSATIQEFLYAGKIVINPTWLDYYELDSRGVYYVKYNTFEEMGDKLKHYISHGLSEEETMLINCNREKLYNYSSWDVLRDKWRILYK